MKLILGIDPGLSGALAYLDPTTLKLQVFDMPICKPAHSHKKGARSVDVGLLATLVRGHAQNLSYAILEQISAAPGQGVVSMFNFGQGYGMLRGILAANSIQTHLVRPVVWKTHMALGSEKENSIRLAKKLFGPEHFTLKKHDGRAEAALLAYYGLRQFQKIEDLY